MEPRALPDRLGEQALLEALRLLVVVLLEQRQQLRMELILLAAKVVMGNHAEAMEDLLLLTQLAEAAEAAEALADLFWARLLMVVWEDSEELEVAEIQKLQKQQQEQPERGMVVPGGMDIDTGKHLLCQNLPALRGAWTAAQAKV